MIGILGGAFDPPHNGHVALAREAIRRFELERLAVWVVDDPGHKDVELDAQTRLELARAAFAGEPKVSVERESHPRTIDALRDGRLDGSVFLVGADEFADFLGWKEPDAVLEHVRLAVATRPGYPRERLDAVLERLREPERVELFELEPVAISSSELRERARAGEPIDGFVPPAVARLVVERRLYRP